MKMCRLFLIGIILFRPGWEFLRNEGSVGSLVAKGPSVINSAGIPSNDGSASQKCEPRACENTAAQGLPCSAAGSGTLVADDTFATLRVAPEEEKVSASFSSPHSLLPRKVDKQIEVANGMVGRTRLKGTLRLNLRSIYH